MKRYEVGEGIEKKEEYFGEEAEKLMSQLKLLRLFFSKVILLKN